MSIPAEQEEVAAFLAGLTGSKPLETHISAVFVGRNEAFKLKKAVTLPFLDFAPPAARKKFLRRELELNRPMAPEIYRDVQAVVRGADGALTLADAEAAGAVDWVLRMAPVPAQNFLDVMAAGEGLSPALLRDVADMVARMHAAAPNVALADAPGQLAAVIAGARESARAAGLPAAAVSGWTHRIQELLSRCAAPLAARAAQKFVRRAHGDLHLGNILLLPNGEPRPFDALEFSEALGSIDIAYDIAFLLMDLDVRVGRDAANAVMNRYLARTGDFAQLALYPLFMSLRAMIRAHVQTLRGAADGARYFSAALAYLEPAAAPMLALGGLQGTGKSTLARALAPALGQAPGAFVLRSDELRKRLHGAAPETRLGPAAYDAAANERVKAAFFAAADVAAASGQAVILDASFLGADWRAAAETAAARAGRDFYGLWLTAPLALLEARIAARQGDASDADIEVLRQAAATKGEPTAWHRLDASDAATLLATARDLFKNRPRPKIFDR